VRGREELRQFDRERAVFGFAEAVASFENCGAQGLQLADALPYRALQARLAACGYNALTGRLAIKVAWERGTIACSTAAISWNREARTFALTRDAYPSLDLSLPRKQAVTGLVSAYFDRYGPATIRDAA
jgi:hypothetical protein